MPRLREHESDGSHLCSECRKEPPIGPCAACESMICVDCAVMSKDPSGETCICISCARLVADVSSKKPQRVKPSNKATAVIVLLVVGFGVLFALMRAS